MSSDELELYDSDIGEEIEEAEKIEFLNREDVELEMKTLISDVESIVEVNAGMCRNLLHKFKWNKEALLNKMYESGDTQQFLIDSQVVAKCDDKVEESKEGDCDICCSSGVLIGLDCNHMACKECWNKYLKEKIVDNGICEIECMVPDCNLLMEESKIANYTTNSFILAKYRYQSINGYVAASSRLKWCPGNDCGRIVKIPDAETRLIMCKCETRFCFNCCLEFHDPIDCRLMKKWLKKCSDDSETSNWMNTNTKDCPKCSVPIEKNGGCNHMRCTNNKCKHEFCWLCMKAWQYHKENGYKCNIFDESKEKSRSETRALLERWLFYYNRYMNHLQSLQLEEKLKVKVSAKEEELQKNSTMTWVDVQFLSKSVSALSECRRTLMYTYAFAFYLKKNNNSEIFESNQRDLEMATENISGYLERELETKDLKTLRQKVQDLSRYVDQRRKALLDHCEEGVENDFWDFSE
ncbi:hypothetical protein GCK72_007032 [Caenorhabditis remanei]|uniref:RBR-type E3 ubiquitin transferase n=1 Tax=Caenorhabditis remanei TaxID=31234 RepID=A0A6A5HKF1_CAERE|nr:hypothetical protein GCK72_007032 [Caenorhabditis remanei]KAF1767074.1 hypothetical protein GCK72_007032 [Caenorhabditis remanei]